MGGRAAFASHFAGDFPLTPPPFWVQYSQPKDER